MDEISLRFRAEVQKFDIHELFLFIRKHIKRVKQFVIPQNKAPSFTTIGDVLSDVAVGIPE